MACGATSAWNAGSSASAEVGSLRSQGMHMCKKARGKHALCGYRSGVPCRGRRAPLFCALTNLNSWPANTVGWAGASCGRP